MEETCDVGKVLGVGVFVDFVGIPGGGVENEPMSIESVQNSILQKKRFIPLCSGSYILNLTPDHKRIA